MNLWSCLVFGYQKSTTDFTYLVVRPGLDAIDGQRFDWKILSTIIKVASGSDIYTYHTLSELHCNVSCLIGSENVLRKYGTHNTTVLNLYELAFLISIDNAVYFTCYGDVSTLTFELRCCFTDDSNTVNASAGRE